MLKRKEYRELVRRIRDEDYSPPKSDEGMVNGAEIIIKTILGKEVVPLVQVDTRKLAEIIIGQYMESERTL